MQSKSLTPPGYPPRHPLDLIPKNTGSPSQVFLGWSAHSCAALHRHLAVTFLRGGISAGLDGFESLFMVDFLWIQKRLQLLGCF